MNIKGISGNHNLNFTGLLGIINRNKEPDVNKFIFMDKHLLDYGIPERVAFVQDGKYCATTVMLYDKDGNLIYSERMSDESADDAEFLFSAKGVKDFVYIKDIKGGKHGKTKSDLSVIKPPGKITPAASLKAQSLSSLRPKDRKAVLDTLEDMKAERKQERTFISCPAVLDDSSDNFSMNYITFVMRTLESDFDFDKVLENLNRSAKNSFEPENIENVTVSPDGMLMRIVTNDGKRASLDFNDGKRMIYDSNIDETGFGDLLIMDRNGPIVKEQKRRRKNC